MLEKMLYFFLPQSVKDFLNKKSVTSALLVLASAASWAAGNVSDSRVQKAIPFVILVLGFIQHIAGKPADPVPSEVPTQPLPAPEPLPPAPSVRPEHTFKGQSGT